MIHHDDDILRWDHTTRGTFSISEEYDIQNGQEQEGQDKIWGKIWKGMVAKSNPLPMDGLKMTHPDLGSVTKKRIPRTLPLCAM